MNKKTYCPVEKINCGHYAGILIEENNPMCNARIGYCVSIAEAEQCPFPSKQQKIERYSMCEDQPAQIDCQRESCIWRDNHTCKNISPAIKLWYNGIWGYHNCLSYREKP